MALFSAAAVETSGIVMNAVLVSVAMVAYEPLPQRSAGGQFKRAASRREKTDKNEKGNKAKKGEQNSGHCYVPYPCNKKYWYALSFLFEILPPTLYLYFLNCVRINSLLV